MSAAFAPPGGRKIGSLALQRIFVGGAEEAGSFGLGAAAPFRFGGTAPTRMA